MSDTFNFVAISSPRKLLMASSTSTSSAVASIFIISTLMWGIRWQTNPISLTTTWKAESSLPLFSAAHLSSTKRYVLRVYLMPWTVTPSSSGLTSLFRSFSIEAYITHSLSFVSNGSGRVRLRRFVFSFNFGAFYLARTSIHSFSLIEDFCLFSSGLFAADSCEIIVTHVAVSVNPE